MKIAYLYNRPTKEGERMGAEKTFADYPETKRLERQDMLDRGGLRSGDTLLLRALSDLGKGAEAKLMQKRIEEIGAEIQVVEAENAPRVSGRKPRLTPEPDQIERLCGLWYSAAERKHVLGRAEDIMGQPVTRDQMFRWCGPRDGSKKPKEQSDGMG